MSVCMRHCLASILCECCGRCGTGCEALRKRCSAWRPIGHKWWREFGGICTWALLSRQLRWKVFLGLLWRLHWRAQNSTVDMNVWRYRCHFVIFLSSDSSMFRSSPCCVCDANKSKLGFLPSSENMNSRLLSIQQWLIFPLRQDNNSISIVCHVNIS